MARTGAHTARVTRVDVNDRVYVELPDVAPGFEFGPVIDTVGGLTVDDRVVVTCLARDEDELVVIGLVGGGGIGGGEPGASAYDIAVEEGFVGSEAAWLASLVGPPGADSTVPGPPGDDGPPGPPGDDGPPGADSTVPGPAAVEIVNHGTDPNVARPDFVVVYWIGTATPVNALDTDWWKES
jgi:hypothetical protein